MDESGQRGTLNGGGLATGAGRQEPQRPNDLEERQV